MKLPIAIPPGWQQLIRYGIVGLLTNLVGYLVYLFITWLGVDPKITITFLYPLGIIMGYMGQSRYAFSDRDNGKKTLVKYLIAHFFGYGLNFMMLFILCDQMGVPHQAVQALAIFVVAGFLFILMKFFVFPLSKNDRRTLS